MEINWKKYFDRIVVLHLIERDDRKKSICHELEKVGLLDYVDWHISVMHPHENAIINGLNQYNKGNLSKDHEYSCAREHYTIIKKAYYENLNNILIIEDDILFLNDTEYIYNTLEHIPTGFDLLQFGCFCSHDPNILNCPKINEYWMMNRPVWTTQTYALSRKGMVNYLNMQDTYYRVADYPLFDFARISQLNNYLTTVPITIQNLDMESNIRDMSENKQNKIYNQYEENVIVKNYKNELQS